MEQYDTAASNVQKNRDCWQKTKRLIVRTLNTIIRETGVNAEVHKEEKLEGMEMVCLTQGERESGIYERIANTKRPFLKDGGYLCYTQIYNGKVSVWIALPVIENIMESQVPEPINIFNPDEIKEEMIIKHVAQFFKEMAEWEDKDLQHHELGYKMRNT